MNKGVASSLILIVGACSRSPGEPTVTTSPAASGSAAAIASAAPQATAARPTSEAPAAAPSLPLKWDDPPRWQRRKPSTAMRSAEYLIPRAAGDSEDAECIVITFGAGQGGGVDQNIDRWVAQFAGATETKKSKREAGGLTITRVETLGTYTPMAMPGAPAQGVKPGWRLIGAIVEAPSGLWFFKLTGPNATAKAASSEFDRMMDSVRPS